MAQPSRQDGTVHILEPASPSAGDKASLKQALKTISLHRSTLALAVGVALFLGVCYLLFSPPRFTASTLLFIDLHSRTTLGPSGTSASDPNVDSANIESQVELLKSEHVLLKLVKAENLLDEPEFAPGRLESIASEVSRLLKFWQTRPLESAKAMRAVAVARSLQKVTSARRIGLTYTVEVSATMATPELAARVANAYARAFIADQAERREESARRASELLRSRTAELQSQAEAAEKAVEEFKYSGSMAGANSANARVMLQRLESTARAYRVLHDKFLERFAETWQQQFISLPDAQVASEAFPPVTKSGPRASIILAVMIFMGAITGLLLIALRDRRAFGLPT